MFNQLQNLKYKFRINPTGLQLSKLIQILGSCRFVWNYFLDKEQQRYAIDKKFNWLKINSKDLTALKQELIWLKDSPSTALQQTLISLDNSLTRAVKPNVNGDLAGFPKFKSKKGKPVKSFNITMIKSNIVDINAKKVKIPSIGWINCKFHREMPDNFKSVQVLYEANKWFVVFVCKVPKQPKVKIEKSVGIDLNSKTYVMSDESIVEIPKPLRENQTRIKRAQQSISRKIKGSNNRQKAKRKLSKISNIVKNKRLDFFHKLSKSLIERFDLICLEDLKVSDIAKFNGKITADNYMAGFRHMIEYKAELYGKSVSVIDRYFPSSKKCSCCGNIKKSLPLDIRTYECSKCNLVIDRDYNAALNILTAGTAELACGVVVD